MDSSGRRCEVCLTPETCCFFECLPDSQGSKKTQVTGPQEPLFLLTTCGTSMVHLVKGRASTSGGCSNCWRQWGRGKKTCLYLLREKEALAMRRKASSLEKQMNTSIIHVMNLDGSTHPLISELKTVFTKIPGQAVVCHTFPWSGCGLPHIPCHTHTPIPVYSCKRVGLKWALHRTGQPLEILVVTSTYATLSSVFYFPTFYSSS